MITPEGISINSTYPTPIPGEICWHTIWEDLLNYLPMGVAAVDSNYNIIFWNRRLAEISGYNSQQVLNKNLLNLFPRFGSEVRNKWLEAAFHNTGFRMEPGHLTAEFSQNTLMWVRVVPINGVSQPKMAILMLDFAPAPLPASPLKDIQSQQLWMLYEITQILQDVHSLEEKLYIILTALTAGEGFGFNRAALFLIEEQNVLKGQMGIGPDSAEEAGKIWQAVRSEGKTLYDYIELHARRRKGSGSLFDWRVRATRIHLGQALKDPLNCIYSKKPILVKADVPRGDIDPQIGQLLKTVEFACVPLIVKQKVIGMILVDNAFTNQSIRDEDLKTLLIFANQAGIAIENARLYESLNEKIDDLASANEKLDWAHDRLKYYDGFAAIGKMAAGVAHEIRNPLNAISLNLEILKDVMDQAPLRDKQEVTGSIGIIRKEVSRLEELVTEFINYANPSRMELRQIDLNDLLGKLLKIAKPMAVNNNLNLVTDFQAQISNLLLDEDQIKRALFNVILNALQAMPDGGTLSVSTRLVGNGKALDDAGGDDGNNKYVVIQVKDSGEGIKPETMPHIFEPFFSTKAEGSGLGLAIVERIVNRHGGKVKVISQPGEGATVDIYLPVEGMPINRREEGV